MRNFSRGFKQSGGVFFKRNIQRISNQLCSTFASVHHATKLLCGEILSLFSATLKKVSPSTFLLWNQKKWKPLVSIVCKLEFGLAWCPPVAVVYSSVSCEHWVKGGAVESTHYSLNRVTVWHY